MTTNGPGPAAENPAPPPAPSAYGGLQDPEVQDLYDAACRLITKHVAALSRLSADAEGRVRSAAIEAQQLAQFIDEVEYRVRFRSENEPDEPPGAQGNLGTQLADLRARQAALSHSQSRLATLMSGLGALVSQGEAAVTRFTTDSGERGDDDPWAGQLREQLIHGQEAERSRLAREIHDGPAQALTNTLLRLQFLESVLATRPDHAAQELAVVRASVRESLHDVRRFIFNLRPASLKEVGLAGTLRRVIADYKEQTGVEIECNVPENVALRPDQELVVFRVIQEALQNVHKHAAAAHVRVDAAREPGCWIFIVSDDGRGFIEGPKMGPGEVSSGLVGSRERAALAGGTLEIASAPGQGTTLTLTIPLEEGNSASAPGPGDPPLLAGPMLNSLGGEDPWTGHAF